MKGIRRFLFGLILIAALAIGGLAGWVNQETQPTGSGEPKYIRFEDDVPLRTALDRLEREGCIRNAQALELYARYKRDTLPVSNGTYQLSPGMHRNRVLQALRKPIRQMVRVPSFYWIARTAELLESKGVCTAEEYVAATQAPEVFQSLVSFPLPEDSLEGYLYPDTYDFPPLLGAHGAIARQLKAFETKVYQALDKPKDLHRAVIIGSMVQLEAALDEERPRIAGVIENRLRLGMRLQIDATVNYGLQVWRPLLASEYQSVKSPYNTYRIAGLPPGPICSPTVASISGALKPETHDYLYYVAMPDRYHLFSTRYEDHLANIRKRRQAIAALKAQEQASS
ncbi:MAG: endolytic transglycosylase MltG [Fimbriimonadaceae bacterium]|nr:endolytic transglycosylase MltG [Fimbriimonadaceae bacterium]